MIKDLPVIVNRVVVFCTKNQGRLLDGSPELLRAAATHDIADPVFEYCIDYVRYLMALVGEFPSVPGYPAVQPGRPALIVTTGQMRQYSESGMGMTIDLSEEFYELVRSYGIPVEVLDFR